MGRQRNLFSIVFAYPFTWVALIFLLAIEAIFFWWFTPSLLMTMAFIAAGVLVFAAWPVVFLMSGTFRSLVRQQPYKTTMDSLNATLKSCSPAFRKPAQDCLALLDRTRQEFQSATFHSELDRIFQNLYDLSINHAQLYTRVKKFGTAEQKRTMQHLLQQQVRSVENSLNSLKTFSGNLTLLDTNPGDYEQMGNDLKAINSELQHVIQEV